MGAVQGEEGEDSEAGVAFFLISPTAFFVSGFVILFLFLGPFSDQEPPGLSCLFRQIRQLFFFPNFPLFLLEQKVKISYRLIFFFFKKATVFIGQPGPLFQLQLLLHFIRE